MLSTRLHYLRNTTEQFSFYPKMEARPNSPAFPPQKHHVLHSSWKVSSTDLSLSNLTKLDPPEAMIADSIRTITFQCRVDASAKRHSHQTSLKPEQCPVEESIRRNQEKIGSKRNVGGEGEPCIEKIKSQGKAGAPCLPDMSYRARWTCGGALSEDLVRQS